MFKQTVTIILFVVIAVGSVFAEGMSKKRYADLYSLYSMDSHLGTEVKKCLAAWGTKSPFKNIKSTKFRVINAGGSVFGLGGDTVDSAKTNYPQLILVNAEANVMGKAYMKLLNPKGWYCLNGQVTVMGKTTITLACTASLASTGESTTVLGATRGKGSSGTTVMGKTVIKRDCR